MYITSLLLLNVFRIQVHYRTSAFILSGIKFYSNLYVSRTRAVRTIRILKQNTDRYIGANPLIVYICKIVIVTLEKIWNRINGKKIVVGIMEQNSYRYTGAKLVKVNWSKVVFGKLEQICYRYTGPNLATVYWSKICIGILEQNWYWYTGAKRVSLCWNPTGIATLEQKWSCYTGAKLVSVNWSKTSIGIVEHNCYR